MPSLAESIYQFAPATLQSVLLSMYGLKLRRLRYSSRYNEFLQWLRDVEFADNAQLEEIQESRFQQLIKQGALGTSYYTKGPYDLDKSINLSQLSSLPILEKLQVRAHTADLYSAHVSGEKTSVINTSGTSGSPLRVLATVRSIQENYAFFSRFLACAGVSPFDRSVTFAGRMVVPATHDAAPFHRFNAATNTYLFSSYHLSEKNFPAYIQALERVDPVFIDSYPSSIGTLARFINARGVQHKVRPRAIVTSSETLTDRCREDIEKAFGCKVFDQYGCAEMACFIYQCEHGRYHSAPEYGVVEVVDDEGRNLPAGEVGHFILTGLLNVAMPLVRYKIGDMGSLSAEACPCGRNHPVIGSLLGRADDLIETPEGHFIGRMDPLFKGLTGIAAAQIIQREIDRLDVLVEVGDGFSKEVSEQLKNNIRERVGPSMRIDIVEVEHIPRSKNGKLRAVVSELGQSGRG